MESQYVEKLSITLPAEVAILIRDKVRSGAYGSSSDLIREAFRGWSDHDRRLVSLDIAIAQGFSDPTAGRVAGLGQVGAQLL